MTREELIAFIQQHDKFYADETMERYKDDLLMKMVAKIKAQQKKNEPVVVKKPKKDKPKEKKTKPKAKKAKKEKKKAKPAKKKTANKKKKATGKKKKK